MIALRADMDGLPIPENNPHLPYKSKTDYAHMCGHDGHMAVLFRQLLRCLCVQQKFCAKTGIRCQLTRQ